MQCPIDGTTLQIAERAGIEIDFCPQCRGVWLDRGELDKIIERSGPEPQRTARHDDHHGQRYDDRQGHSGGYRKKKRGGFLEDLFDF